MNLVMNHTFHLKQVLGTKIAIWILLCVVTACQNTDATCTLVLLKSIKLLPCTKYRLFIWAILFYWANPSGANAERIMLLSELDDALQLILSWGPTHVAADRFGTRHLLPQLPAWLSRGKFRPVFPRYHVLKSHCTAHFSVSPNLIYLAQLISSLGLHGLKTSVLSIENKICRAGVP